MNTSEQLKKNHLDWIKKNYPNKEASLNRCNVAVADMVSLFSDLAVQVGYANGRYHCWCKGEDGIIVDPTANQFDGKISYTLIVERFLEKDEIEVSTGAIFLKQSNYCLTCGEPVSGICHPCRQALQQDADEALKERNDRETTG